MKFQKSHDMFFCSSEIGLINVWKHHVFTFERKTKTDVMFWMRIGLWKKTVMFLILRPHWLVEEKRDGCEFCFCNIIALWKENTWCVLNVTTTFSLVKEKIWCFKWMQRHYFLDRRNVMFLITHLWFFFYFKNRHLW